MEIEEIEKLAYKGENMPKGLTSPESAYFQGLCYLYARFKAGFVSQEQAAKEKQQLFSRYEMNNLYFRSNKKTAEKLTCLGNDISVCNKNAESCECCKMIAGHWNSSEPVTHDFKEDANETL